MGDDHVGVFAEESSCCGSLDCMSRERERDRQTETERDRDKKRGERGETESRLNAVSYHSCERFTRAPVSQ